MENHSESSSVLTVNHPPPLDLQNKAAVADENLQNLNPEKEVHENTGVENRNQLKPTIPRPRPNGHPTAPSLPERHSSLEFLPMIDEFYKTLVENTKSIQGAKVENHKLFVSLNYRNVDEKNWPRTANCVSDVLKNYPRLRLTHQPKVFDVRPVIAWKGTAVDFLRKSPGIDHHIMSVGEGQRLINSDDRTDENAFQTSRDSNKLYIGKISRAQIFSMLNFIMEIPTLVFEQLSYKNQILYGTLAMSFSILTVTFSITEFIYKGRNARAVWRWQRIPWLYHHPPSSEMKLFGSMTDIIGLVSAILQCIFSVIAFYFYGKHKDNPIKISVLPRLCILSDVVKIS